MYKSNGCGISRQESNVCSPYCSPGTIIKKMEQMHFTREMLNGNKFYPMQSLDLITSSKTSGFENLSPYPFLSMILLRTHPLEVKNQSPFKEL